LPDGANLALVVAAAPLLFQTLHTACGVQKYTKLCEIGGFCRENITDKSLPKSLLVAAMFLSSKMSPGTEKGK